MNRDHASVEVVLTQELKPEMVEQASRCDLVIFVKSTTKGAPGTVFANQVGPDSKCEGVFAHELTPCSLLAATKVMYKRCPEALVIEITGQEFGFGAHLSPRVEAALPKVFERIQSQLSSAMGREAVYQ